MSLKVLPRYVLDENDFEMLRLKKDVAAQFIDNVKNILNEEDINFTGDLSESLSLVIIGSDVVVETNNPHAGMVEWGLPAGNNVSFDKLHDWVKIKLQIPDDESVAVTWKIMNKIKKDGIKPKRFWKKSILKLVKIHGLKSPKRHGGKRKKHSKTMKLIKKITRKIRKLSKFMKKNISKGGTKK